MAPKVRSRMLVLWLLGVAWLGATGELNAAIIGPITQITTDGADNGNPQISGTNIMWQFYDGDYELKFYNGGTGTTTRLTTNSVDDYSHSGILKQISGSTVVWATNGEVYKSVNGSPATAVGTTSHTDQSAGVDGSTIVWRGYPPGATKQQIMKDTGSGPVQLTPNTNTNTKGNPAVSGSNVAWTERIGTQYDVFLDGSQITNTTGYSETSLQISGSNLAWKGNGEIFFYNGTTTQLTTIGGDYPQLYGSNVVWGAQQDIFLFDGTSTTNITAGLTGWHNEPQVSDQFVVWYGEDQGAGTDAEIFLYDMLDQSITQVTNNAFSDYGPQISGTNLTWYGNGDIFYASFTGAVPEPSSMVALTGLLGMGLIGYLRQRRKSR